MLYARVAETLIIAVRAALWRNDGFLNSKKPNLFRGWVFIFLKPVFSKEEIRSSVSFRSFLPDFTPLGIPDRVCGFRKKLLSLTQI